MAITKAVSNPQDSIRKGLTSIDSCSQNVPTSLRDLLSSKVADKPGTSKHSRGKSVALKSKAAERTPTSSSITDEQRSRLAVEVLNNVLQLLKDHAAQSGGAASKAGAKATNLDNMIECGTHSIVYLNSREDCGLKPGTRESAHLNFVNRLVQVGKVETASEHLLALKLKLCGIRGEEKKKSLESIFDFSSIPSDQEPLSLAINVQIAGLRLLAAKSEILIMQKLPKILESANNVVNMIKDLQALSPAKSVKQFDSLATATYTCGSTLANSRDTDATKKQNVRAAVELKLLSVHYRVMAARMQDTAPSTKQIGELWTLLAHSITAARSQLPPTMAKQNYQVMTLRAKPIFEELLERGFSTDGHESKILTCSIAMTTCAEDAQNWKEAIGYLENLEKLLNPKQHQNLFNVCQIRSATCLLKAEASSDQVFDPIEKTRAGYDVITQPLSGSKEKLQSLFSDIMQLRRASSGYLNTGKAGEIAELCLDICFAVISFSRRCAVAGILDLKSSSKERQMIISSVDNFLVASRKVPRRIDIAAWWEREDQRLQEILALARLLSDHEEDEEQAHIPDSRQNIFEKVSVFYQQHSITLRKENEMDKSIQAFKRSTSCFDGRPLSELVSGNLAVKLEKLGAMYIGTKDYSRALECTKESLDIFLKTGNFESINENFGESQLDELQSDEEKGIARSLTHYVKCCMESQKTITFWDSESLSKDTRSYVLLYQIQASFANGLSRGFKIALPMINSMLSSGNTLPIEIQARAAIILASLLPDLSEKDTQMAMRLVTDVRTRLREIAHPSENIAHDLRILYHRGFLSLSICLCGLENTEQKIEDLVDGLENWDRLLKSNPSLERLQQSSIQGNLMIEKLNLLVDFLDMRGHSLARKQALEQLLKLYKILNHSPEAIIKCKISLSVQYLRLGFSGKSGSILSEVDFWMKKVDISTPTRLEWSLAYAEYLISIGEGNLEKGMGCLLAAKEIVDADDDFYAAAASGAKMQKRIELNCLVSRACYVSSLLALESGNVNSSIALARRSLKLMQRSWAGLEALAKHKSQVNAGNRSETGIVTYTTSVAALSGPFLWPIVRSIYDILIHIATLYLHQGMQRESLFYVQEARLVAEAVNSKSLLFHVLSIHGDLHIRMGLLEEGQQTIRKAAALKEYLDKGKELVAHDCTLGIMYRKSKSWARELDAYNNAEKTLEDIMGVKLVAREGVLGDITDKIASLQIDGQSKPRGRAPKASTNAKAKSVSKGSMKATSTKPSTIKAKSESDQCVTLMKIRDDVLRLKAVNLAIQKKWDLAQAILNETANSSPSSRDLVTQRLAVARSSLLQALAAIDEDDEFHTLQETPIAIPSVSAIKYLEPAPVKSGRKTPKKVNVVGKDIDVVSSSRAALLLQDARDNILAVQILAAKVCGTTTLALLSSMLGEIVCLLAAITSESSAAKTIPAINSLELYRGISLVREKSTIEEEKLESLEKDDLRWPSIKQAQSEINTSSLAQFQQDYIDIIPPTWTAISISLGESREELFFTRYEAGHVPFMIRVPLKVNEHEDVEEGEEDFGFEKGLSTFQDIIKRANVSTHSAKDMITKDIRAKWWLERESLDNELHDLLLNIENNWLRGYKGIFGGYKRHPDLISKFNASFTKVLNQHLPSRNSGKKKNTKTVILDEKVVELFLGIGDPTEEDVDLDDSIQDLIYLVIDILQFHGEKNAPDEIDLDEMIVLITDALENYHNSVKDYEDTTSINHTVLILDKSVHALPWESLPCLDGRSVSRLPSLEALRDRLQLQNFASGEPGKSGVYINRSNTGYVLNPALDLTNTQKTYEEGLKSMNHWEGLIGNIPTENDFVRYLEDKDLFLYFGHGSGAQYIRARTVKKLNQCAVSLLMGCSSGKLTDAGDFEPYGMPLNYIQGGSPAVVVTLWDVTDKDIDKYSSKIFESWGLFKEEKEKKGSKGKSKLKVKYDDGTTPNEGVFNTTMSLCEAAATSRTACKMRYLNGAAPVVYGVPVYLN